MPAKRNIALFWMVAALATIPAQAKAVDTVQMAFAVCKLIMNTGLASECEVDGWDSAIDFWVDTNSGEAREMCALLAPHIATQTGAFAGITWQMRIFSPYTGDHPLAVCDLG